MTFANTQRNGALFEDFNFSKLPVAPICLRDSLGGKKPANNCKGVSNDLTIVLHDGQRLEFIGILILESIRESAFKKANEIVAKLVYNFVTASIYGIRLYKINKILIIYNLTPHSAKIRESTKIRNQICLFFA
jgi:hypothetical protein